MLGVGSGDSIDSAQFTYAVSRVSRWRALGRYLDDGSIEIDNSAAERALRVVALGRKNYLFAGSDEGGSYCPSRYLLINRGSVDADREMTELACVGNSLLFVPAQYAAWPPGLSTGLTCRAVAQVADRFLSYG